MVHMPTCRDLEGEKPKMKKFIAVIGGCLLPAAFAFTAHAADAAKTTPETTPLVSPAIAAEYVRPHQLVDIGNGRKLNLFCMGSGPQTVLFDAGGSDWSVVWALVQPLVALHARACSYDRSGMGYSDPSNIPRSSMAIVDDLHKLILAAKIATPVVMVGHSMGGFDVKLYAALYPEEVAGLVLVDPAEERGFDRVRQIIRSRFGAAMAARLELGLADGNFNRVSQVENCATAAREHDLVPKSETYYRCADPPVTQLGPEIAAERQRIQVTRTYQETQASEFSNGIYGNARADGAYGLLFSGPALGDKPIVVLTRSAPASNDPTATASYFAWNAAHNQTANLSGRGINRIIPDSNHYIHIGHPTVVVDAIDEVLSQYPPKK